MKSWFVFTLVFAAIQIISGAIIPAHALQAPTVTTTVSDTSVTISWTPVPMATGYILYYALYPDARPINEYDMGPNTSFTTDLSPGSAYYVSIRAKNRNQSSMLSNIEHFVLESSSGAGWEKTYPNSGSWGGFFDVQQTTDGGYIITGQASDDISLVKTDQNGDEIWSKAFGSAEPGERGRAVQQTADGGFIITGSLAGSESKDICLIKTDSIGNESWSKSLPTPYGGEGLSVQQTVDGGYIIAGQSSGEGLLYTIFLAKFDHNGNVEWTKEFGEGRATEVRQTTDGGYIISGMKVIDKIYGLPVDDDCFILKTDNNGNEEWSRTFGGPGMDGLSSVQQTTDSGFVLTGSVEEDDESDIILLKVDNSGNEEWSKKFGGKKNGDTGLSVIQTTDGGFVLTGAVNGHDNPDTFSPESDICLIKTDSTGITEWSKTYLQFTGYDSGQSVQQTSDGGYIVCGMKDHSQPYLLKTDHNGDIQ